MNRTILNTALKNFIKDALLTALTHPRQAAFFIQFVLRSKATRIRLHCAEHGLQASAVVIFSITSKCNLACKYCYAQALHPPSDREMEPETIRSVVGQAEELGVSFIVVAGGEPFLRPELLDFAREYNKMLFIVFTNGLLIAGVVVEDLGRLKTSYLWLVTRDMPTTRISEGVPGFTKTSSA